MFWHWRDNDEQDLPSFFNSRLRQRKQTFFSSKYFLTALGKSWHPLPTLSGIMTIGRDRSSDPYWPFLDSSPFNPWTWWRADLALFKRHTAKYLALLGKQAPQWHFQHLYAESSGENLRTNWWTAGPGMGLQFRSQWVQLSDERNFGSGWEGKHPLWESTKLLCVSWGQWKNLEEEILEIQYVEHWGPGSSLMIKVLVKKTVGKVFHSLQGLSCPQAGSFSAAASL